MGMILAIDQGTTNTKALLVDPDGRIVARASSPLSQRYPQPGWVEQDPVAIWDSVRQAVEGVLAQADDVAVDAVAVSNQRETVTAWERRSGQPLGPAIGWQCHRTADFCQGLRAEGLEPLLRRRTGLTIDPMFSGTKMRWLLDHIPDGQARAADGEICLGTMDSWVLWNLTGGRSHACDLTNASRTQLLNLATLAWDDELLAIMGVPRAALPVVALSGGHHGLTAADGPLPAGVPVASLIGDSHGALYGHASPGAVKATYGTGSSLMCPTPTAIDSAHGISATIAWSRRDEDARAVTYALEGNIYATGAAAQWAGRLLGLAGPEEVAALAAEVDDTGGVYFVPAFAGLGAPHWLADARGLFSGITLGTGRAEIARAAVEAIAFQVCDVFQAMEADAGRQLAALLADGGASRNDRLMQFQANLIGRPVERSASPELSALGVAYLAGLTVGTWPDEDALTEIAPPHERFEPDMSAAKRDELYAGWQDAVARAGRTP